ncbi:16S rRNA (cytosine(967)-C(5))-methyltransferase RsmB [Carnobacteriaceae bacterium zg-ZUI240]|nr:16S rRNA (cytosine(967)-C(5))-methyltransferase RsmB [Carnobacteriaceae bacterium zg-ZUI240]
MNKSKYSSKSQKKKSVRYLAMQILNAVEQDGAYVNLKLSQVLNDVSLSSEDSALLTEIVYGVTQRRLTLDAIIDPYVKTRIPLWLRNVLRISAFQIIFLDRIPNYAVLSQASEIVRMRAGAQLVNFARGVIHELVRNGQNDYDNIMMLDDTLDHLAIKYSAPSWLIQYFIKHRGKSEAIALFESLLWKPYIAVRTNGKPEILQQLRDTFKTQESPLVSSFGIRVLSGQVAQSPLFSNGDVTIQDETSMLVALAGDLNGDDNVLDACAAPGGKTTHMAQFLTTGQVTALDVHEHKLDLIRENATRLNVQDKITPMLLDARSVHENFKRETFDKIFVDAPCSGLGLMRRKPDIKYTKLLDGVHALSKIQWDILNSVEPTLKTGGRLIYSTCTLTKTENQDMIKRFLQEHQNYKVVPLNVLDLPEKCYTQEGYIEIFPHAFHTDGFFIAVLEKQ